MTEEVVSPSKKNETNSADKNKEKKRQISGKIKL